MKVARLADDPTHARRGGLINQRIADIGRRRGGARVGPVGRRGTSARAG